MSLFAFERYGTRTACIDEKGNQISYQELMQRKVGFVDKIPKRSLEILIATNTIECIEIYTASLETEIVPVLLEQSVTSEQLQELLYRYQPQFLWIPIERSTLIIKGYTETVTYTQYKLYRRIGMDEPPVLNPDLALLLCTSGSTGNSKCVRISYENLRSNTEAITECLEITEADIAITALPMAYTYGLSVINTHLYKGAVLLLTDRKFTEPSFWRFFRTYHGTSFAGVPYTYEILKKLNFHKFELPSLRVLTQAGGKLGEEEQKYFGEYAHEKNLRFYIMYGQTEATARMSYLPPQQILDKPGSVGIPIPGGKLLIETEDGKITDYGKGEILYKGKNVTMGYAESHLDLRKGDENRGFLRTGDWGEIKDDGYLYIYGRNKDFVKICGYRINLNDIVDTLRKRFHTAFFCRVSGQHIVICGTENAELVKKELKHFESIKKFLCYCRVDTIPRNESGKVIKGDREIVNYDF